MPLLKTRMVCGLQRLTRHIASADESFASQACQVFPLIALIAGCFPLLLPWQYCAPKGVRQQTSCLRVYWRS